ncbi:MAG: glycosyltransferase family 9 protein [Chthoniobacterales bacterium]
MRLLFIKLRHIGDALLLTPTLAAVKQALPRCEIWVVVRKGSEGILAGCPHIDQLRTAMIPEHGKARDEYRGRDRGLLAELRAARFEHAFELSGGDRGRWMALLSGARGRTANTPGRAFPKWWRLAFNRPSTRRRFGWHELQRDYLTVADILPLPEEIPAFRFEPSARQTWAPAQAFDEFAVVHAGTRWERKSWPEERWIEAGRALLERVPQIVLSSGPDPRERALNGRLCAALGPRAISTDGQTDWSQLAWLLSRAKLFAGVDTAAMHLAAACQCPTVALFGGSKYFEWYPWRVRSLVVRPQAWIGEERTAGMPDSELMRAIPVEKVVAAFDEVLAGGGTVRPAESALVLAA